jgi:cytochrome P450
MTEALELWIEERRSSPGANDLLERLLGAEVHGERLSVQEVLDFVQLLLIAGNETTANLIDNALLCLLEDRENLSRVESAPGLLETIVEEALRYRSPVQWVFRGTTRDVELRGSRIPAGKLVLLGIGSANRDPAQFPDADRFIASRKPNPHVAFGAGPHVCLGAALSRLEARVALSELLSRLKRIELASGDPWTPRRALHVHGPESLPLRFEPERASGPVTSMDPGDNR